MVVKSDGSIWFTDPRFGILSNYEGEIAEPELPMNVYRVDGKSGAVTVVADGINAPNGLAFSPDEKKLYIVESRSQPRRILVYDVQRRRKSPTAKSSSMPARRARRTASAATSTAICGAAGA